ncbi:nuclear pore complex protein NUP98A-like [Coffea eugenioides]|uniref:nuclear pore complex protein NUP98A-like n=1 Tax=Coffea eugenioides TaxID=49369 RepID=UPI000F608102|nr:nuclear pore complex protein NUP98A-like [Coffea eugenioides]
MRGKECSIFNSPFLQVKVFCNEEKVATFKVDNALISKENPGPQVFNSTKDSPWNDKAKESSGQQGTSNNMNESGTSDQTSNAEVVQNRSVGSNLNTNGVIYNDNPIPAGCFHIIVKEDDDGEVADSEEGEVADNVGQNPNIAAIMPKIHSADCYTKPPINELAARERAEPGFCACVKDFVFGRQGYGSIKFLGETDVRELDLESLIQFNHGEVIVYMDESRKPPIGQGLNRPAEITLFNVRCIDKNSRKAYIDGPKVEKYKEILRQKAAELGAEMVSYDPQQGEWKFKFQHF